MVDENLNNHNESFKLPKIECQNAQTKLLDNFYDIPLELTAFKDKNEDIKLLNKSGPRLSYKVYGLSHKK